MEKGNIQRVHIIVSGGVQGVGYRYSAIEKAQELKLVGWVRNTLSEGVEIVAEGDKYSLEKLSDWCKMGPTFGRVDTVNVDWQKPTGEFTAFNLEY